VRTCLIVTPATRVVKSADCYFGELRKQNGDLTNVRIERRRAAKREAKAMEAARAPVQLGLGV